MSRTDPPAPQPAPTPDPDNEAETSVGIPQARFRGRLLNRLLVPYSVLIILSFTIAGGFFLHTAVNALDDSLSKRLVGLARLVAAEMKPSYLERLGPGDESTRLYRILMDELTVLRTTVDVDDIFIVDRKGRVLLDADEEIPIGREYLFLKLDAVELSHVWDGEAVASTLYEGDDGVLFKGGYAPIRNRAGEVFAAVGVEAGAGFLSAVERLRRNVVLLVLGGMLMTGVISLAVSRSIVGPVKRLVSAIGEVKGDGHYPTVAVTTRDEVGYLTQAFNRMTERLQEKDAELTRLYELERDRAERIEDLSGLVFEGIPNGVIAVDTSARVLLCNQAAARIVPIAGYPFPETGIPPVAGEVLEPENPILKYLMTSLEEKHQFLREDAHYQTADGQERVLGISAFPLADREEHPVGAIAIFSDLTEVTRLQEQIKIQERLAALGEMSAGIAHEIRNPLGAIRGFVELLGRRVEDPRGRDIVTNILKEIVSLNHIVTDFLTFAREPSLEPETVRPEVLIEDSLTLALPPDEERPVEVALHVADSLMPLFLDPGQVKKALVNIIQNGVNAMGNGGGTLTIEVVAQGNGVAFRIADSGPGIPEDMRGRIFNPFFTTRAEGTGLGLPIANKVVEGHGGRIHLENPRGGGARFILWFPYTPVTDSVGGHNV